MFWTIVVALILVFWVLPMLFSMVAALIAWLVEELGCGGTIFLVVIILILILLF